MELILVRHGQPAWTDGVRSYNDPGLTDLGHAQARAVADRLADPAHDPARGPVDRLFVSPAVRAQETAAPIAEALGLPAETLPWLTEIANPPEWEGGSEEDIQAAFAELRGRTREGYWDGLPNGESPRAFARRIIGGVADLLGGFGLTPAAEQGLWDLPPDAPGRVIAVAHGGTNSMVIAHLLNVAPEPWEWERFAMGHASVAVLASVPIAGAHLWSLRALGDANHLPVDERTR